MKYHALLDWYASEFLQKRVADPESDALLSLRGSGKTLWASEHSDDYGRRFRQGWDRTIKAPDAIQLSCLAQAGIDLFITSDDHLRDKIVWGIQFILSRKTAFL